MVVVVVVVMVHVVVNFSDSLKQSRSKQLLRVIAVILLLAATLAVGVWVRLGKLGIGVQPPIDSRLLRGY